MREIKFRAYAVEELVSETQWLEGWGVSSVEYSERYAKEIGRSEDWYLHTDYGDYQVRKGSIGQYTGLKDKNGREIFEGDIYHMGDPRITYTVVWHDTGLDGKQNGSSSYVGLSYWQDRIEVIGNVFENKELLEGK